jgi:hypothetical protein
MIANETIFHRVAGQTLVGFSIGMHSQRGCHLVMLKVFQRAENSEHALPVCSGLSSQKRLRSKDTETRPTFLPAAFTFR